MWNAGLAMRQLADDGYCHVPGVLEPSFLETVQDLAAKTVESASPEHRAQWRSQGSLIALADHPAFAVLIAYPGLRSMFDALGLPGTRYTSGYIISKPPGGRPCSGTRTGGAGAIRSRAPDASPRSPCSSTSPTRGARTDACG